MKRIWKNKQTQIGKKTLGGEKKTNEFNEDTLILPDTEK